MEPASHCTLESPLQAAGHCTLVSRLEATCKPFCDAEGRFPDDGGEPFSRLRGMCKPSCDAE